MAKFKVGDTVRHMYGHEDETVKAVGDLGGTTFVVTEQDPNPYPEGSFALVAPRFPRDGTKVRSKTHHEETGTLVEFTALGRWRVALDDGATLEADARYLLKHFEEVVEFPSEGVRFQRRNGPDRAFGRGRVLRQKLDGRWLVQFDNDEHRTDFSTEYIEMTFKPEE